MTTSGPELWILKGIEVKFRGERPEARLMLELTVDGLPKSRTFEKREPLSLDANRIWTPKSHVGLALTERHRGRSNKTVVVIKDAVLKLDEAAVATLDDPSGMVLVTMSFVTIAVAETIHQAHSIVDEKSVLLDKLGRAQGIVGVILAAGDFVGDLHPAAKAAFEALKLLYNACDQQAACRDAAMKLTEELKLFVDVYGDKPQLQARSRPREAQKEMLLLIAKVALYIHEETKTGIFADLVTASYRKTVDTFKSDFRKAHSLFDREVQADMFGLVVDIAQHSALQKLGAVDSAYWKSDAVCLPGTRTRLLRLITEWAKGIDSGDLVAGESQSANMPPKNIFWLLGPAGSGKSTVANSVAETLASDGLYLTCYFCSRDGFESTPPHKILPTIAHQLARLYPPYREVLMKLLSGRNSSAALNGDLKDQRQLLFESLLAADHMKPPRPVVVVIDGLDNCGRDWSRQALIATNLVALAQSLPWLRLVISSRDRRDIRAVFQSHCIETDIKADADVASDVQAYIRSRSSALHLHLEQSDIDRLVAKAAGLFEWCSVVFRFLESQEPDRRAKILEELLAGKDEAKDATQGLRILYDTVLDFTTYKKDLDDTRKFLGVIYITSITRPLPIATIALLIQPDLRATKMQGIVDLLRAFIFTERPAEGESSGAVRAHHLSFLDYLESRFGAGDWPPLCDVHNRMATNALVILSRDLKFNHCDLDDSSHFNSDVQDLSVRISHSISQEIRYSALFWMTHAASACSKPTTEHAAGVRSLICQPRVLFWLEVLTLQGQVERSIPILRHCSQYFSDSSDIAQVSAELHRFVTAYHPAMASTPHLYISALSWLPTRSRFLTVLPPNLPPSPVPKGRRDDWDANIWTRQLDADLTLLQFSPQGNSILLATKTGRVYSCDADSGKTLWEFSCCSGPQVDSLYGEDRAIRVVQSPCGTLVAFTRRRWESGCDVHIRDASTGQIKHVLEPPNGPDRAETIVAVDFSSDSKRLMIASKRLSSDTEGGGFFWPRPSERRVRVWETSPPTYKLAHEIVLDDGEFKFDIAFSPDGNRFVTFYDIARIVSIRSTTPNPDFPWRSLAPAQREVQSSGPVLQFWHVDTGRLGQGLAFGQVKHLSYSPNGAFIVAMVQEKPAVMQVWSALSESGDTIAAGRIDADTVSAVAWSPDSKRLALWLSDASLLILDVEEGVTLNCKCEISFRDAVSLNEASINISSLNAVSLMYSANGRRLICCPTSARAPAFLCDLTDSALETSWWDLERLRQSSMGRDLLTIEPWTSIAFSPDGTHLVVGSSGGLVRFQDLRVKRESDSGKPRKDISSATWPLGAAVVACSPNGQQLILRDEKKVLFYRVGSGRIENDLQGISGIPNPSTVVPVYFPDGGAVASLFVLGAVGSVDYRTHYFGIWDTSSGKEVHKITGHTDEILCLSVSQNGERLVSGSRDNTARIWSWDGPVTRTRAPRIQSRLDHRGPVHSATLSPDNQRLASIAPYPWTIFIWNVRAKTILKQLQIGAADTPFYSRPIEYLRSSAGVSLYPGLVTYLPSGTHFAAGIEGGIRIWDAKSFKSVLDVPYQDNTNVSFSRDGARLITGDRLGHVSTFSVATGQLLDETRTAFDGDCKIETACLSSDERLIFVRSPEKFAMVYTGLERADIRRYCANMDVVEGWVKDDDGRLLLWIPTEHRDLIRANSGMKVEGNTMGTAPVIDWAEVRRVGGKDWAKHFEASLR